MFRIGAGRMHKITGFISQNFGLKFLKGSNHGNCKIHHRKKNRRL